MNKDVYTKAKIEQISVNKILDLNLLELNITRIELDMLKKSIIKNGLINPIIVKGSKEKYQLICGRKRLKAIREAGIVKINAIVLECETNQAIIMSLAENICDNGDYIGQAYLINELIKKWNMTCTQIARELGSTTEEIRNKLKYLNFTNNEIKLIKDGNLSEKQAILAIKLTGITRIRFIYYIMYRNLNYKQSKMLFNKIIEINGNSTTKKQNMTLDNRLIINTLKSSINSMKKLGINASIATNETEIETEYIIRINKSSANIKLIS